MWKTLAAIWIMLWGMIGPVLAQDLSALARLDAAGSSIDQSGREISIRLQIGQPVPWRVRVMDAPPRLILDMREVDWAGLDEIARDAPSVLDLRAGVFRPGWSRLVAELDAGYVVHTAQMVTSEAVTRLDLVLQKASDQEFAAAAAVPEPADWVMPKPADLPKPVPRGQGPIVIVLDPGHGGIDPGAERDGYTEANLMLTFAREFKELLLRDGRFKVVMTREEDIFVPLEARISVARAAGAHLFLSLHADALAEGEAVGATVYTLSDEASDEASAALAERHDRDDLLAGVDLTEQDDLVAAILMDMARTETEPRIDRLAMMLEEAIKGADIRMHRFPHQKAGFSVLKSPDIPSALIELGFLSSARDLAHLIDPAWRARMAQAMLDGIVAWVAEDAALSQLRAD